MSKPSDFICSVEAQGLFQELGDALVSEPILATERELFAAFQSITQLLRNDSLIRDMSHHSLS